MGTGQSEVEREGQEASTSGTGAGLAEEEAQRILAKAARKRSSLTEAIPPQEHGNTAEEEAQRILAKAARKRSSLMEAIPPQEQGNTAEEEAQRILAKAARNKSSWMEEALYTDWDDGWSV